MGSYSSSSTRYDNTPQTLDGDNPLAVAGSVGTQLGGEGNISGTSNLGNRHNNGNMTLGSNATYNALDGGAIQAALALGSQSIGQIAQLTKDVLAGRSSDNVASLGFAERQQSAALAVAEKNVNQNPNTIKYLAWAVAGVAAYWLFKGKV